MAEKDFKVNKGIQVVGLAGNTGELVSLAADGTLQASDITGSSLITASTVAGLTASLTAVDAGLQSQVTAISGKTVVGLATPALGIKDIVYIWEDGKLYSSPYATLELLGGGRNFVASQVYDFRETSISGSGWSFSNATGTDTEGLTGGFIYAPTSTNSYMVRAASSAFNPHKYNAVSVTYKTPTAYGTRNALQIYYYDGAWKIENTVYLRPTYGAWVTEVIPAVLESSTLGNSVTSIRFDFMNNADYSSFNLGQIAIGYLGEAVAGGTSSDASTLNGLSAAQITGASKVYTDAAVAAISGGACGIIDCDTTNTDYHITVGIAPGTSVVASVIAPSGAPNISHSLQNLTVTGVDVVLGSIPPVAGYKISYVLSGIGGTSSGQDNPYFIAPKEYVHDLGSISGAIDFDLSLSSYFLLTLTGNATASFTNPPTVGAAETVTVMINQVSTNHTITWNDTKWAGGTAGTLTSGGLDMFNFVTYNNGAFYIGVSSLKDIR